MSSSNAMQNMAAVAEDEDRTMSDINTTPLVDVMLVLLIVFMITIPVAIQTVPLQLPNVENIAVESKAEDIALSVNKEGQVFWNGALVSNDELLTRLETTAKQTPQPEVHVRADQNTRYEHVGRVIVSAQRKGIMKVGFITDPPKRGG